MADMYAQIQPQKQHKPRSGKPILLLLILVAVILLAACIIPVARTLLHQYHYKQYVSQLSKYTTQAYYKHNLRADVDGVSLRIEGDNVYGVYTVLSSLGSGQISGQPPEGEPDATLTYGSFATLKLWDVPLTQSDGRPNGVYVEYHSSDMDFSCLLKTTDIGPILVHLSPDENSLWDE